MRRRIPLVRETSKSANFRRARKDFESFLHGKGIDIGSGDDCLNIESGSVQPWDVPQGDAQLMSSIGDEEFDFVYSSHCLEHMRDVRETLRNWVRILKPGGFLYVVVPDYVLYEKMTWPSCYNSDHKHSFSTNVLRQAVNRPNHHHIQSDLIPLLGELGIEVVRLTVEDFGFNYNAGIFDQTMANAVAQICFVGVKAPKSR